MAKTGNIAGHSFGFSPAAWLVLVMLLCSGVTSALAQAPVALDITLSRDTVGLDEQAVLEVTVRGSAQDLPRPNLPTLPMFEMYSQGQSTNLSITNGQVESSVAYRYLILPKQPGSFLIQGISVVYQNKRYVGNPVSLTVLNKGTAAPPELEEQAQPSGGQSRDYFLEATVDNKNPYVSQQITLTLKFYLAVRIYGSPELVEPTTTGFWTELLGNKAPYYQKINNRTYRVIERSYALFPTQTGDLTIGRATITATVASNQQRRDPFDMFGMLGAGQEVQVMSPQIAVKVRPLPEAGKPGDFTGTVGKFNIRATASRNEVEVNQPVSVSVAISGTGNIKSVADPILPDLPDFRIYKESSNEATSTQNDKINGTKTVEVVFIPKRPGQLEIPSLSFNYFDPEASKYKTIATRPISLNVLKGEGYAAAPETPYSAPNMTIGSEARDIRYIKTDIGTITHPGHLILREPLYIAVNAAPVLLLIGTVMIRRRREKLAGDVGYARARRASREARRRLSQARKLATVAAAQDFYAENSRALLSFIADKLNISPHGLTTERIKVLLTERNANPVLISDTIAFLQKCDFARFAPAAATQTEIDKALGEAEDLMVRMEGVRF